MSTHTVHERVRIHTDLYSEANRFVHSLAVRMEGGGGGETLWGRGGGRGGEREEIFPQNCSAYPPSRRELGFWTPASVVWFSPAWLCVSSSGPWLCAQGPLQSPYEQTTWRDQREGRTGAQIKANILRIFCDSSSTFLPLFGKKGEDKKKKRQNTSGHNLILVFFQRFFFLFLFLLYIFPLTSIFHELICFVAPPRLLLYWIHLVPIHPVHNLSITGERGKLIIYWWNGAAMNF